MLAGYVGSQIRRTTRNVLVINVLIVVILLVIPLLAAGYIGECLRGPFPVELKDIARYGTASDAAHRFVTLHVDPDDFDQNYYHISGGNDNKNDYYLFLHLPDGRYLIVKTSNDHPGSELVGSLTDFSSDVRDKVIDGVRAKVQGRPADVVFDLGSYRGGMWGMLIVEPLVGALAVWNILKAVRRRSSPETHPIAKQLAHMGPPEEIAIAVDAEIRTSAQRTGKIITTVSWLARPSVFGCQLVYLGDVVWAYKKQTKQRINGIPAGSTFALVLHETTGRAPEFTLTAAQVDRLLAELAQRVPWAIIGFDQKLAQLWAKQRPQFIATIAERKEKLNSAPPAAAISAPPIQVPPGR